MKDSFVEGVAARDGPETCGVEALTGATSGWV